MIIQGHEIAGRMPLFQAWGRAGIRRRDKTQTRRIPTDRNCIVDGGGIKLADLDLSGAWIDKGPSPAGNPGPYLKAPHKTEDTVHRIYPRIQVGDIRVMTEPLRMDWDNSLERGWAACYSDDSSPTISAITGKRLDWIWKRYDLTAMHMPHEAARTLLKITGIKWERVQDISEEDAKSEGVDAATLEAVPRGAVWSKRQDFAQIWNIIHGADAWERNDWVIVPSFEVDHA